MREATLGLMLALLGGLNAPLAQAAGPVSFALTTEQVGSALRPVSATQLDPTTQSGDPLFGGRHFSASAVALDIVINGWRARNVEDLQGGAHLFEPAKSHSRWRIRASFRRLMVRYEITF
ncbi:MAG: hypothetical protein R3E87_22795 [Burkholderiaceae bacterium]